MNVMMFDNEMKRCGCKKSFLANNVLGITEASLWKKRTGVSEFKVSEIAKMKKFFGWNAEMIDSIFFARKQE